MCQSISHGHSFLKLSHPRWCLYARSITPTWCSPGRGQSHIHFRHCPSPSNAKPVCLCVSSNQFVHSCSRHGIARRRCSTIWLAFRHRQSCQRARADGCGGTSGWLIRSLKLHAKARRWELRRAWCCASSFAPFSYLCFHWWGNCLQMISYPCSTLASLIPAKCSGWRNYESSFLLV